MTEKIIIEDCKHAINRLQAECSEKTDLVILVIDQIQLLKAQYNAVVKQNKSLQSQLNNEKEAAKIDIENLNQACLDLKNELDETLRECEELKEQYKWYNHYKDSALYNKDLCNKKSDEIDRFKQALDEIEEIVTPIDFPEADRKINFGSACHTQILDIIKTAKEVNNDK